MILDIVHGFLMVMFLLIAIATVGLFFDNDGPGGY